MGVSEGPKRWTDGRYLVPLGLWKWVERRGLWISDTSRALRAEPLQHLGAEVVLLQLAALPQVPAAHRAVQAPGPEPSAVVGNVDAAGTVGVALELPAGRRAQAAVGAGTLPGHSPAPHSVQAKGAGATHLTMVWFCRSQTTMLPSLQQEKQTLASGLTARA